jgi:hypothetical protein
MHSIDTKLHIKHNIQLYFVGEQILMQILPAMTSHGLVHYNVPWRFEACINANSVFHPHLTSSANQSFAAQMTTDLPKMYRAICTLKLAILAAFPTRYLI